jgi:hypothetical protein
MTAHDQEFSAVVKGIEHECDLLVAQLQHERATVKTLRAALMRAVLTIRAFHGIGLTGRAEPMMWDLYQQSPEMKAINAALKQAQE